MSLTGKYILEKTEKYDHFLTSLGVPEAAVVKMVAARPSLDVNLTEKTLKVLVTSGNNTYDNCVTLGEMSKIQLAGIEYDLNIVFEGSIGKGTFNIGSKSGYFLVEVTDAGITQSMTIDNDTATKFYKRQ